MATVRFARAGERRAAPAAPRRGALGKLHASCRAAGAAFTPAAAAPSRRPALARASLPRRAATQLPCAAPSVAMESRARNALRSARLDCSLRHVVTRLGYHFRAAPLRWPPTRWQRPRTSAKLCLTRKRWHALS